MKKTGEIPDKIKKIGFDFEWDSQAVWSLEVPVEEMDISSLEWHFDFPFWSSAEGYYDLTPREVLDNSEKHSKHYQKMLKVDLQYPIAIMYWRKRWLIMDGLHRLVKIKWIGLNKAKVRKIPRKSISKIKKK